MAENGALHGLITRRKLLATASAAGAVLSRPAGRRPSILRCPAALERGRSPPGILRGKLLCGQT